MFHELGHAIHHLVARTKYAMLFSRDFIEIPSIMLENWIWIPEVLVGLSRHKFFLERSGGSPPTSSLPTGEQAAQQTEETLPLALAEAVCRTKASDRAHTILSQVQPALFDLAIHSPADHQAARDMDTTALWHQSRKDVLPYVFHNSDKESGFGQGGFPHVFRKYDAGYFAYPM